MARIRDFPKLKGQENYHPWSKNMKSALKCSRLWDIVDYGVDMLRDDVPEEEWQQQMDNRSGKSLTNPVPPRHKSKQYETDLEHWKDLNSQARELIYALCEEETCEYIEDDE